MPSRRHTYRVSLDWTGNLGPGTAGYDVYSRDHTISDAGKPPIQGSSDPAFRGDPARWNPEALLVGSIAACHKLWYLHLCAVAGIAVLQYHDQAEGIMQEDADGGGRFTHVALRPSIVIRSGDDIATAEHLHQQAHGKCFIANSVNFPVTCTPRISLGAPQS